MKKQTGFTLIEVVAFLVVTGLLLSTILLGARVALKKTPAVHQQWQALQVARGCMEWFVEQRRINGYDSIPCPDTPATSSCVAPAGYTIAASVSCSSWSGDSNYKTISVSVSGPASVSLSTLIGDY